MKTCLNKDDSGGQPRTPEFAGHLEKLLQQYLQTHFPAAAHSSSPKPLNTTIMFVQRFASSAGTAEFSSELARLLGSRPIPKTALELVTDLADVFCQSAEGIESDLLKKSVQEALLMSIDVQAGSSVSEFRDLLREYLVRHGNMALTRLFIGIHMFDSIWLALIETDFVLTRLESALGQMSKVL